MCCLERKNEKNFNFTDGIIYKFSPEMTHFSSKFDLVIKFKLTFLFGPTKKM